MASVVVVGGGVAGLGAALGLDAAGHAVTVVERDGTTSATSGVDAFASWERPHTPQFRQPHTVLARARNILCERAPAVVERLLGDGVEEVNFIKMFAPPEAHRPEDDSFTSFMTRRPAFELALRRTVEDISRIDLRDDTVVTGLITETRNGTPSVSGIVTDHGPIRADVVIDAGGRRSPVCRWMREVGVEIPERMQDCELTYHSRHFELTPASTLEPSALILQRVEMPGLTSITFPGEHRTFSLCLAPAAWDDELKVLRHHWAWDAAAAAIPALAPWVDPRNAAPIGDVVTMAGHTNLLREIVVDGRPVALGVLPVGDALCTTNPTNGWGISMALTTAFAAVDAIDAAEGDAARQALLYHDAVHDEVEAVFVESSAHDRLRNYRWRNQEVPPHDRDEAERAALLKALPLGAVHDLDLGRELVRRVHLLQSPRETLTDPDLRARAETFRLDLEAGTSSDVSRADVLAAIVEASP